VDVPMVVSSAYAAETADAPEPNSITDASMSAATFLKPGFIVFRFLSGMCRDKWREA
jgi:hypothetical protein